NSDGHGKSSYMQYMQHFSGKHIKSTETLDCTAQDDKFNMPFLCKPSSKLISLIHECINSSEDRFPVEDNADMTNNEFCILPVRSALFHRDVFRFIFSCYNIDLYSLVSKGTMCASAYRAFALNALNWLIMNVSSAVSLHDIMWIFVCSLMPVVDLDCPVANEK